MSVAEVELELHERPAHPITLDVNATGVTVCGFSVILFGWAVRNASATTLASFDVYDGTDHSGVSVFPVNLAANEASREWFGPNGIEFKNGVYFNVTAQHVTGAVFIRHRR